MKPPDRHSLPDGLPCAYGAGESPVAGYTIGALLGKSELSETYLAQDTASRRWVLRRLRGDAREVRARLDQIDQIKGRNYSHVVVFRALDGSQGEDLWLAREYLTGVCLADVLGARDRPMLLKEANRWGKGIAAGLRELIESGAIHGRLKPANVWLDRGVVKLVDGIALQSDLPSTSRYAAPETAAGRNDEADLFALGALLVEMLTGKEFAAEADWRHRLAAPYQPILARALDPDPARRWESVEAFVAALNAAPQQLRAPETPPSRARQGLRPARSSVVLWTIMAATLLILAAAVSLMLSLRMNL